MELQLNGFDKEPTMTIGDRVLTRGDQCWIKGILGPWTFLALVHPRDGRRSDWVDVIKDGRGHHSFAATRVKVKP